MSIVVLLALLGVVGAGLGFVLALVTRRPGSTLVGGCGAIGVLYMLYIVTVGEGAPFVVAVMMAGATASVTFLAAFAVGVWMAGRVERSDGLT